MNSIKIKLIRRFNYSLFIEMVILVLVETQTVGGGILYELFTPFLWVSIIVIGGILRLIFTIFLIRSFNQFFFKKATRYGWVIISLKLLNLPLILTSALYWINQFIAYEYFILSGGITILIPIIYLIFLIGLIISNIYLKKAKITLTNQRLLMIKRAIIDLGTNFTRLEIQDVAEECNMSREIIDDALNAMINQKEIYGNYDKKTGFIEFDQDANIDEIDILMKKYSEWEEEKILKKIN